MCPPPIKSQISLHRHHPPVNRRCTFDSVTVAGDEWSSAHLNVSQQVNTFFLYLRKIPQFQDILGVWSGRVRLLWETVCTGGQGEGGTVLIMLLTDTTSKTVITNVKRKKRKSLHPERLLFDLTDVVSSVWDLYMFHNKNKRTWTLVEHCERSSGLVLWANLEEKTFVQQKQNW